MKSEPFVMERTIKAPIEKVWEALTNKDQMKQWYFDLEEFKPEVGFRFEFEGGDTHKKYLHKCEITEVIPDTKLSHSWRYDGFEGNSFVTWELFPEGDTTRVKLTHEGLETFPPNIKAFAKENFVAGWTEIVGSGLPKYLENN